jgi:hypothetical protein
MAKLDLAYNRQVSLVLIAGFSLALVIVAGWLVFMIMSANGTGSIAADPAALISPEPPRLESNTPPLAVEDTPDAAPASSAGPGEPFVVTAITAPDGVGQGDLLPADGIAANAVRGTVPLPHARPRRIASVPAPLPASVPVPKRRPPIDGASQATRDWSVFDLFGNQR